MRSPLTEPGINAKAGEYILAVNGKNLTANAKFCSRCGRAVEEKPKPRVCAKCRAENLPDSIFCNECGEKL